MAMLLVACASRKKEYHFESEKTFDSISYTKVKTIFPSLHDTLYIDNPCDSITGRLQPFTQTFTTAQGKVLVEGKDGRITTRIALNEVESVKEESVAKHGNDKVITNEKVVVKESFWKNIFLYISLVINALLIIFILFSKKDSQN
jgi:hypothetical protein